jgi:hypothetical protein
MRRPNPNSASIECLIATQKRIKQILIKVNVRQNAKQNVKQNIKLNVNQNVKLIDS